ncbi:MAG: hypothetical protein LAO09_23495, partial [Acidobacteriia bacterium]|nr:hypothetical protein [Terriglobia bacterium]
MPLDTKHADLQGLRIDRSAPPSGEPANWARRYILIGIEAGLGVVEGLLGHNPRVHSSRLRSSVILSFASVARASSRLCCA